MDKNNPTSSDADAVPGKDNSDKAVWRYEVPEGDAGAGTAQSNAGHYTGGAHGGDPQQGDFLHSDPENNVVAPGAPQSGRGSAEGSGNAMGGGAGGMSGGGGGGDMGSGQAGAGGGEAPSAGAGAGAAPGTPKGNGSKDEPIWGS